MSRPSLTTPLIVVVLVAIASLVNFTVASSPSESAGGTAPGVEGKAAPTDDTPARGLLVGHDLTARAASRLARALPGWRIDSVPGRHPGRIVPMLRRYKAADREVPPVVVMALGSHPRAAQARLYQYAVDMLPAGTTVVLEAPSGPGARAARVADVVRRVAVRREHTCATTPRGRTSSARTLRHAADRCAA